MSGPDTGDVAPDFTLRHTMETQVSLGDLVAGGPAVVCFYVFDFGRY